MNSYEAVKSDMMLRPMARFVRSGIEPGDFARLLLMRDSVAVTQWIDELYANNGQFPARAIMAPGGAVYASSKNDLIGRADQMLTFLDDHLPHDWFRSHHDLDRWMEIGGYSNATDLQKSILRLFTPHWWLLHS